MSYVWLLLQYAVIGTLIVVIARAVMNSRRSVKMWIPMLQSLAQRYGGTITPAQPGKEARANGKVGDVSWSVSLVVGGRNQSSYTGVVCSLVHAHDVSIGLRTSGSNRGDKTGVRSFDASFVVESPIVWVVLATPALRDALQGLSPETMVVSQMVRVRFHGRCSDVDALSSSIEAAQSLLSQLDSRTTPTLRDRFQDETDAVFRAALVLAANDDSSNHARTVLRLARGDDDHLVRFFGVCVEKQTIDAAEFGGYVHALVHGPPQRGVGPTDRLGLLCGLAERLPSPELEAALDKVALVEELAEDAARTKARMASALPQPPTQTGIPDIRARAREVLRYAALGTVFRERVVEGLLVPLFDDPEAEVRRAAALGLFQLDAREVRDRLHPALSDPDVGNDRANEWSVSDLVREMGRRWERAD